MDLPVIQDLRALGNLMVVLLAEDGRVFRYDPIVDQLDQILRVSPEAVFTDTAVSAAALIDLESQIVYEIAPDHVNEYPVEDAVVWASPVEGGLAMLTASDPPRLSIVRRTDPEVILDVEAGGRAVLVTAWGRQVVQVGPGENSIQIYATDDGSLLGEVNVGGPIRALAGSPSSHEIYVSIDDPPRLVVVSRFGLSVREVAASPLPIRELRPELFGGSVLMRTSDDIRLMESEESVPRTLAGTWRSDLPLGLSPGRTIILQDDESHLLTSANVVGSVLSGGAPAWWIPLRWNPSTPGVLDEEATVSWQIQDVAVQEPESELPDPPDLRAGRAGHYAIVVSARQRSGVAALLATLSDGGYPTRLQQFPDEAGSIWFRGLVGPFPTRGRAQAAARQLQREFDLQAWVTELGGTR